MHAHRVYVLDEADRDHVALRVPDHLQLQLLPAQDGLLHQHLSHQRGLEPPGADSAQLVLIVHQPAACAAHGVGRAQDYGVSQLIGDIQGLLHGIGHLAAGHLYPQGVHGLLELDPVLAPLDGIHLDADDLHLVSVQNPSVCQLRAQVQAGLPAQVGQQRVRALLGDDLLQTLLVQGLDVGHVRRLRIRHDGGGVGIHQYDFIAQLLQGLAGLGAGVVELTGLADDDGAGADDEHFVDVCSLWHVLSS